MAINPAKPRIHPRARHAAASVMLTLLLAHPALIASAEPEINLEYKVKAAFLVNFIKFVKWPETAFAGKDSPWVIGIVGDDPFGEYLDKIVKNKKILGRKITIRRLRPTCAKTNRKGEPPRPSAELTDKLCACHVLFVGHTRVLQARNIIAAINGKPTLSVGQSRDFTIAGGIIRFYIENKKVRFAINPDTARAQQLRISSKLLRLAKLEKTGKPQD